MDTDHLKDAGVTPTQVKSLFKLLSLVDRLTAGENGKAAKGVELSDLRAILDFNASDCAMALLLLEKADLIKRTDRSYQVRHSQFLDQVMAHGWVSWGRVFLMTSKADGQFVETTDMPGRWELSETGYIETEDHDLKHGAQLSRITDKGKLVLDVWSVLFPVKLT